MADSNDVTRREARDFRTETETGRATAYIGSARISSASKPDRSMAANVAYGLLNPIPFGLFAAALIFDVVYERSGVMLWDKSAAWLIAIGLLFAVVPRLINLVQVWITARRYVLASDKLGHLALTREGCRRRDELVLGLCHRNNLPVVVCMGGGYSERIIDIVEAHANTFRVAAALW